MDSNFIVIRGAKEHNLKDVDLQLPRNKFIVITGLSGSGKSSLAFDTIYAEGQRRYVESLSAYARQFLEQLQKPDVEYIEGLSPTISIEQKTTSRNPRSTVATQTEIYDYLRLLFARVGTPYCHRCGKKIERQTAPEIAQQILQIGEDIPINILAPLIQGRKGEYRNIQTQVTKAGFVRLRVDGKIYDVADKLKLDKFKIHHIEAVVDRLNIKANAKKRLTESIETALKIGNGLLLIDFNGKKPDKIFSERYACTDCGINLSEIEPRIFSFNSPYGACPKCNGLGTKMEIDPDLLIGDPTKPWIQAIASWGAGNRGFMMYYRAVLREIAGIYNVNLETPFKDLDKSFRKLVLSGSNDEIWGRRFEGVTGYLERLFRETDNDWLKDEVSRFMSVLPCPECKGTRLKKESLAIKITDKNINQIASMSIKESRQFFSNLNLSREKKIISEQILKEIIRRLDFCINVGLEYLTLDRKSATLSGGEAERIRLATQVGSGLVGVIYVLDEPSIGLHQKDNIRLLKTLEALRDLGNTLIVVEHDEATIRAADYVVDLGPGAGEYGGEVIYAGDAAGLLKSKKSTTGQYLRGELQIALPLKRREAKPSNSLKIFGARQHNLKNVDVTIPLGVFVCIAGVSGSGKSTLVDDILFKALAQKIYRSKEKPGLHKRIEGISNLDKVIVVDQSPIGRTPRSNPATYTGVFSQIRDLFSQLPEAKLRGYKPGRFSFNVKGGRCEACSGDGIKKIEMHFLPDVYVECEVCKGLRFTEQTLEVRFKGSNISEVLNMSVQEAMGLFDNIPRIRNILQTLCDVGLGYIKLGQPATTLSGGEAQRVKLASELCKYATGKTLYILDEPTTGLHFADVDKLLNVLQRLVDRGNTVLVIEHNLEVIKTADYIIDLGPEGGDKGGEVIFAGTPEELAKYKFSYTGQYLKDFLHAHSALKNKPKLL
ncbi:MAG TPA: excinuclease ABC subunit UvrA [Candidatus Omnitrophota bacterium]|nr:excinuclease ABC subunit UvrA [Candidatus Omnitrophota bacterium]HPD85325.1 excinuclease ABC subunit UvrA [Candidatus Omnitrophota bacterium]HRZ04174.1 excinuclease ABC subunit UvrA [Candidatus Omnitrophota bacterium]